MIVGISAQHRLVAAADRLVAGLGDADANALAPTLSDDVLVSGLRVIADARKALDVLTAAFTAEVDLRSARELGYTGLAQRTGHRTVTDMVQNITGQTRSDVVKAVRTGRDPTAAMPVPPAIDDESGPCPSVAAAPWFTPMTDALSAAAVSHEQYDAIRRGLGEPPDDTDRDVESGFFASAGREAPPRELRPRSLLRFRTPPAA